MDFGGIYAAIIANFTFPYEIVAQTYSLVGWVETTCAVYVRSLRMNIVTRLALLVHAESNFSYSTIECL